MANEQTQTANLLQVQAATKAFGGRLLFDSVNFSINESEHVGVIGPNGAGKTSLFRILASELELDSGEIVTANHLRLGYLKQHDLWDLQEKAGSFLEKNSPMPLWELKRLGVGLDLKDHHFESRIQELSGGYRMRFKLLQLLGQSPNLMLLDEPTNYLDLETTLVLEEFLQTYQGSFLLISHDREFLRRTTDHILEIENQDVVKFNGNIDDYFEQKRVLREQLEKQALHQQAKRKHILDFAARFGAKASKARQVQSKLKSLQKMERVELKSLPVGAKIQMPNPPRCGRLTIEIKKASLGYANTAVLQQVDLKVEAGDRIGIVGFNGAGKSTLLKAIAKQIPPLEGEIRWGHQVEVAYFSQMVAEALDPNETVREALSSKAHPSLKDQEVLNLAGSLLFSGGDIEKPISVLSGGERARVALGQVLLGRAAVLLLDEPTNHLDFYTVEALTQALASYSGTLLCVSHDRGFIGRVASKIYEVRNRRVEVYPGNYDDYLWSLQRREVWEEAVTREDSGVKTITAEAPSPSNSVSAPSERERKKSRSLSFRQRESLKELERARRDLNKLTKEIERKIKSLESRLAELAGEFSERSGQAASSLSIEISASQRKLEELESEYLKHLNELEDVSSQIKALKAKAS
ncbi:MAG: ATP-binding cassette domain-containing protein [Bradymonadales bacterium]|nr:MAG: ATP-binding cassette domain-containing protein [Bradymonadales bacterium]